MGNLGPQEKVENDVYSELSEKTAQHVDIVYELRAETDDVAIALTSAEFFERRGYSVERHVCSLSDLAWDVDTDKITEPWSAEIVRELLAKGEYSISGTSGARSTMAAR